MATYLVDTNVLLRLSDSTSPFQTEASGAIAKLEAAGNTLVICSQNIIEFWSVASRPATSNGLGWSVADTERVCSGLSSRFGFLPDSPMVHTEWLRLCTLNAVQGRRVHDVRFIAMMTVHGITHLLTYNPSDFKQFTTITIVEPANV